VSWSVSALSAAMSTGSRRVVRLSWLRRAEAERLSMAAWVCGPEVSLLPMRGGSESSSLSSLPLSMRGGGESSSLSPDRAMVAGCRRMVVVGCREG